MPKFLPIPSLDQSECDYGHYASMSSVVASHCLLAADHLLLADAALWPGTVSLAWSESAHAGLPRGYSADVEDRRVHKYHVMDFVTLCISKSS